MLKRKQQITILILGIFLFAGAILPVTAFAQDYEDSPFGFHPGSANNYQYIQDLGASWDRPMQYLVWDWVDTNRNGNFKFKDATAPPKPGVPNSGGSINYDAELINVPDNVMIIRNICPFRSGGEFASEADKTQYYSFVKAAVERYDGDDDFGCTESYPDCYNPGDNEYPEQELIDRLEKNSIKHWQNCNQLTDACNNDCHNTSAKKFAELQKLTYLAAKEADSTVQVLIAGDSHVTMYPDVFNELNGNYIDIIDFHRFGDESQYNPKRDFDYLKNALINAGFNLDNLKFWITETSTYSGDPIPKTAGTAGDENDLPYQNEKQHARGLLKIYISGLAQGVEKVFWAWNIVEGFEKTGAIWDYNGLIYDGCEWTGASGDDPNGVYSCNPEDLIYDQGAGIKKLGYYSYKLMVEKLESSDWDSITTVIDSVDNKYAYKFINDSTGEPTYVAWWDYFDDTTYAIGDSSLITLTGISANHVIITNGHLSKIN